MIIGSGDIAKVLHDREGAVFFVSGVSDSSCTDEAEFDREIDLLLTMPRDKCIFYFSSIAIYTKSSPYMTHKLNVEHEVKSHWKNCNIIRIGNISWGANPNTFLNYLRAQIDAGKPVEIYDEYRYMINKKELLLITDSLPLTGQNEINIFSQKARVINLL